MSGAHVQHDGMEPVATARSGSSQQHPPVTPAPTQPRTLPPGRQGRQANQGGDLAAGLNFRSRWLAQLDALTVKNLQLLWERKLTMAGLLSIPSVFVLLVDVLQHEVKANLAKPQDPLVGELAVLTAGAPVLVIGAVLVMVIQVNLLCNEKQSGLTSLMRMIGLYESAYWASNLLLFMVTSCTSAALAVLVGLFTDVAVFNLSGNIFWLWVTYAAFFVAQSALACFLSSFICRPAVINILSFLMLAICGIEAFAQGLLPTLIDITYGRDTWNFFTVLVIPLLPWISFARVFDSLGRKATLIGEAYTFADLTTQGTVYPANSGITQFGFTAPSALFSLMNLVIAIPALLILAWWMSQMYGGEVQKRFWFPCSPTFWGCASQPSSAALGDEVAKHKLLSRHEQSVRMHKVSKNFKEVNAVKEVSLTMERNKIFCLLGTSNFTHSHSFDSIVPNDSEHLVCGRPQWCRQDITAEHTNRLVSSNIWRGICVRLLSER
jgi:hypothetical protein